MDIQAIDTINLAESLQKEMHDFIEYYMLMGKKRGKNIQYQDAQTTFFLLKIAELQKQITNERD